MEESIDADLIFDLGVHKGEDSEFYLKKGFRVIGVEASSSLCAICQETLKNYVVEGRFKIYNRAIFSTDGLAVNFFENTTKSVWNTMDEEWVKRNNSSGTHSIKTTVMSTTVERLIQQEGVPYYMKVDIEGMDSVALNSLSNVKVKPKYISAEADFNSWKRLHKHIKILKDLGYQRFNIVNQGVIQHQICPMPSQEGEYVEHQFRNGSSGLFGKELPGKWYGYISTLVLYYLLWLNFIVLTSDRIIIRMIRKGLKSMKLLKKKSWYDTHASF